VLITPFFSALRINELELNPLGTDTGKEWIELYNDGEIDLAQYKLINNDGDELDLIGIFSEYYVYKFDRQWLDNTDEKIFLYYGNDLIDETELLNDNKNNDKTWNYCSGWEFTDPTKEGKNICEKSEKNDSELNAEEVTNETKIYENKGKSIENYSIKKEPSILNQVKLNPKDIKEEENSEGLNNKNYAIYSFIIFCILLAGLFVMKKYKYKNEF